MRIRSLALHGLRARAVNVIAVYGSGSVYLCLCVTVCRVTNLQLSFIYIYKVYVNRIEKASITAQHSAVILNNLVRNI